MKKYLLVLVGLLAFGASYTAAYQQQGFNQYNESGSGVNFRCQNTCVMLLGDKGDFDLVSVAGSTQEGTGLWGYGYLMGGQVYTALMQPAEGTTEPIKWIFADDRASAQLPSEGVQVVFLVVGPLRVNNATVQLQRRTVGSKLSWVWDKFLKLETLAPYSVNLHYGPMVGAWSWPFFGLIVVIIAAIIAAIRMKHIGLKKIVMMTVAIMIGFIIIGGIRLLVDNIRITSMGLTSFSWASDEQKSFFDLGDYIAVTDKVREALALDDVSTWKGKKCTIYARSHMSRPFDAHWNSVYLRPCDPVQTGSMADYQLFYNTMPNIQTGTPLLTGNNFVLFDNTSR